MNDGMMPVASRRGPMRPRRLVSVRASRDRRLRSHLFRSVDVFVVGLLGVLVLARSQSLGDVPLRHAIPLLIAAFVLCRAMRLVDAYRFRRTDDLGRQLARVALSIAFATIAAEASRPLVGDNSPRWIERDFVLACIAALFVLHTVRWLRVRRWRTGGLLTPNLVVVGATAHAESVISAALDDRHVNVVAVFDDRLDRVPDNVLGVPVLGTVDDLLGHRILPFVDRIVVAVEPGATRRVREISTRLAVLPNEVTLFLDPTDSDGHAGAMSRVAESALADVNGLLDVDRRAWAKRVQDLAIGVPMLLALSPLMAAVALLVRLDSPGPVFFRQIRHGFNNEEIRVWKFRSMRVEATDSRAVRQVTAGDDRVTRVGRILRKTSLDEIPQLFNVIRGEMSLVGPRPHAVGMRTGDVESAALVADYAHRHRIKPGMTGWAAVNGSRGPLHAADDVQRRVALDVDYIARQSFRLDLRIMLLTVPGMLGDRQAIR